MAVTAQSIIDDVTGILQDASNVRWSRAFLLSCVNDSQREVCNYRPDASTSIVDMALVTGWLQTVPASASRLMEIKANVTGRSCTLTKREALDSIRPNWRNDTAAAVIKAWVFDERDGRHFEVWPPAASGAALKCLFAVPPADCANEATSISIDEQYKGALISCVLHLAYLRDSADEANKAISDSFYAKFLQQVSGNTEASLATLPNKAANTRKDTSK